MLWALAFLLPFLVSSHRVTSAPNLTGIAFVVMYALFGVVQLVAVIRRRSWSDIAAFGIVPALFLAAGVVVEAIGK